jgi:ABC-type antimicrobial peptide transport system permease subunit
MERHKKDLCVLNSTDPACKNSSTPRPIYTDTDAPSPITSQSRRFRGNSMMLYSVIGCFSCIMIIVLLIYMTKKRQNKSFNLNQVLKNNRRP